MFRKLLTKEFNKLYANKELMFCHRIYEDLIFYECVVAKCCHSTKINYVTPLIYTKIPTKFNFFEFILKLNKFMKLNQTDKAPCEGCKFLIKQKVPELQEKHIIKFFTINHFSKCNSNCIYCKIGNKTFDIFYELLPFIKELHKKEMIHPDCLFNWGGGEPTICSEFESIAKFLYDNKLRQAINSSGIVFSETILNGLKDNSMSIQISVDSGTEETYKKIKRQNNFNKVWENIKRYAQYPDMLFVKYIFFSMTANEVDVREFIKKCCECGVKKIVIDCESDSSHNPNSKFGIITNEIADLAVLMKKLAIENNINYEISYQWSEKYRKYIEGN